MCSSDLPINHPRHGAYLIDHGELRGFNIPQKRAIALLVRSQRRAFHRAGLSSYAPKERQRMTRMAFLLRLAIVLCMARNAASVPDARLRADGDHVWLTLPKGWLAANALSADLLADERDRLLAHDVQMQIEG